MPEETIIPNFMTEVHRMVSEANQLIEVYSVSYEAMKDLAFIPDESKQLILATIKNISEMKVALTSTTEHIAEVNDALDKAVEEIEKKLDS